MMADLDFGMYGLQHSNHDFSKRRSFGKNIFTNTFPISLGQYMHLVKGIGPVLIRATTTPNGGTRTEHTPGSWPEIIGVDPEEAYFHFERVYEGYQAYTHGQPNKSDVVAMVPTGEHVRPFEIKLVVVPTSGSAHKPREEQTCELVVRPPSMEQLAFSICHTYGPERRIPLQETMLEALGRPLDYAWASQDDMVMRLPRVVEAARNITRQGLPLQTPLVLLAVWRSQGQQPLLDEHAFDLFAWTDLAFLQLFVEAADAQVSRGDSVIGRPARALIWLIYSLWEYASQGSLRFTNAHSSITYGAQTDKAGSFTNQAIHRHVRSQEFLFPRVKDSEIYGIIDAASLSTLAPERRLDAALAIQHLLNMKRS